MSSTARGLFLAHSKGTPGNAWMCSFQHHPACVSPGGFVVRSPRTVTAQSFRIQLRENTALSGGSFSGTESQANKAALLQLCDRPMCRFSFNKLQPHLSAQ